MTTKRVQIDPSPDARELLGDSGPALTVAVEAWSQAIRDATADVGPAFSRREWNLLADVMNSPLLESYTGVSRPGRWLAVEVADAERFYHVGRKWACDPQTVIDRLNALDGPAGWAVLYAVRWFWDHSDGIDHERDEWWTLGFRKNGPPATE